jgi:hypothetical protein
MTNPEPVPPLIADPVSAAPAPPTNTFFRGPNGIRAGWRVLLFLLIWAAQAGALVVVIRLLMRGRAQAGVSMLTPLGTSLSDGTALIVMAIAALIMARIEGRRFGQYGLPLGSALGKDFWVGTFSGFLSITACLLGIFAFHGFHITGLALHGSMIATSTLAWAIAFVMVGLAEEFSFRGYLQFTLTTGMGFWPAALLMSALFGLVHAGNPGETRIGLLSVVLFGLLFCVILRRTGNLWWCVGFHAGWDWGQTFFYGVPDSGTAPYHNLFNSAFAGPHWLTGGSVGPEASVFTPIVLVIVAILFTRVYRENRYPASSGSLVAA